MSRAVQVALIGQKFMGRAHSNAWSQVNHFFELARTAERHTVAARDAREIEAFAKHWGWKKWTADWRTLATDDEIELVDVGTPNDVHAEQAIAMLEASKHVACEKPLAGSLADARAMRDAAKKAKRKAKTFVWYNYRRCPAVGLAWKLVQAGRIGRVYHVRAHYLQSWGGADTPLLWRFQKKHAGTGAHGDLNAHIVDLARFLVGEEIFEIHGAIERTFVKERVIPGTKKKGKSDVDDCVLFLASFAGGATASFEATRLAHGHQNDNFIELNGEKGSLRFSFEDMNVLWFCDGTQPLETRGWQRIMSTSAGGGHPYAKHWWPDAHVLGYEHGFVNMAADILRVLGGEAPELPLPDFEDAYQTQRVLEAALVSARERSAIKLSDVR
ncbi:MAG: Gfo/Idh/MocA family oxidoreductase [Planctomycetes bacterium]|nr:Gfo/Idh/MocA family oxidoreductase [Planctomycetota bacterium]